MLEKINKSALVVTAMTAMLSACGGDSGSSDLETGAATDAIDSSSVADSSTSTDAGADISTAVNAPTEAGLNATVETDTSAAVETDTSTIADADAGTATDSDTSAAAESDTDAAVDTGSNTPLNKETNAETVDSQQEVSGDTGSETDASVTVDSSDSNDNGPIEVAQKIEPPTGFAGEIESVITPSESDPFSKFQLDDALYTNNVYDGRQLDESNNWKLIFYNGDQDYVRWEVPALLGNNPSPCARPQSAEPLTLSYRLTSRKDSPSERNTFVRAYPAMVVGSMGGRYESWGVECGDSEVILPSVKRHGGSPVYQMERVAAATGLPVLAGDLDYDIKVSVKADLNDAAASTGIANLFMDSYWHNVSDAALVPGGSEDLVDTINGLSSDFTEVWNLNIWFDYPRFEGRASSWTGGFKIGSVDLDQGGNFDIYFKIEGRRDRHIPKCRLGGEDNCFLYIGLVATDTNASQNGITVSYTEIANWMQSAEFRDLFLTGATESDTPSARAYEAWRLIDGEANDKSPDPARRGPRFPDKNHVIGGIHLGSELWYNPDAEAASIEFEALGVEVEGKGQFGLYVEYR